MQSLESELRYDLVAKCGDDDEAKRKAWNELALANDNDDVKEFLTGCIGCDSLIQKRIVEPPQVFKGVLHQGGIASLTADSKAGKTKIAITAGLCVTEGIPFLGIQTNEGKPGKVLYINFELPEFVIQKRVRKIKQSLGISTTSNNFVFRNMRGSELRGERFIDL